MSTSSSLPSSPVQGPDTQPVNQNSGGVYPGYEISENSPMDTTISNHLSYRERLDRNRLTRLSSMPSWMYRGVIDRLMLGASPRMVAGRIFEYPDEQRGAYRV